MFQKAIVCLSSAFVLISGGAGWAIAQGVRTLNPVFSECDAVLLPAAEGEWIAGHSPLKAELAEQRQICPPKFPFQDGWLGGDGDVSVALSSEKTLWLFSDTFIGKKAQKTRSGSRMISNTVAITTCLPNGQSVTKYYWRDRDTNHPKPFFESHTSRYKYWVTDALMIGDTLYVILEKISAKTDPAPPDDIFNFQGVGYSLAKVAKPNAAPPDRWNVELLPWSCGLGHDVWNGQVAADKTFVYMFITEESKACHILRFPVGQIESPEGHIEYFATDGSWKGGALAADTKILWNGELGQTVEYHPDLKEWIMICGPGFLNNKIRIRTAPELTGPWTEEIIVYECPESTPGSAVYDPDNFCYLGREHIKFYDSQNQAMLVTYDCNSAQFRKLVANMAIYSPRVIWIPLRKLK